MLTAPELASSHQDLPQSLFCHVLPQPPALPTSTGHPQNTGHISPSHLVCSICHVTPCPPHHQPSPSQDTLQQSRSLTQQSEHRTSPSLPQLPVFPPPTSTPIDTYLKKKSPLKPKPIWGLDAGEREPFRSMVSRHSGKQHYLSLAPSSAPDKRGFPLDLLFKTCPKAGTRRFQINELEPPGAGGVPVPCPVPGAPTAQLLTPPCQTSPFSY